MYAQHLSSIGSEVREEFAGLVQDIALSHVPPVKKKTNALRNRDFLSTRLAFLTDDQQREDELSDEEDDDSSLSVN